MKTIFFSSLFSLWVLLFIGFEPIIASDAGVFKTWLDDEPIEDTVPAVISTVTNFDSIIVVRFKHGTDILSGLERTRKIHGIKNAVIITGIGSVTKYHVHVVDNTSFPSRNVFVKKDCPADITNITGYFFEGRIHAHITLSDEHEAIGGHLEPGTSVFTFCVLTIAILPDNINIDRYDDKNWR